MKKTLLTTIVLMMALSGNAFAHDAKSHKGPMIEGKLVSIEKDRASLETDKGKVMVTLSPETKFEVGMDGEKGERSQLKEGQYLMVMGHKLESGEFAASEVMMHEEKESSTENMKH